MLTTGDGIRNLAHKKLLCWPRGIQAQHSHVEPKKKLPVLALQLPLALKPYHAAGIQVRARSLRSEMLSPLRKGKSQLLRVNRERYLTKREVADASSEVARYNLPHTQLSIDRLRTLRRDCTGPTLLVVARSCELYWLVGSEKNTMALLEGEKLQFEHLDAPSNSSRSDAEINKKYATGEVRIVTETARYPLSTIRTMVESGDYELNPEFQRRHRWSKERQSRLIESFIMNVPIPPIFLYEDRYSHYQVMDGLQRMTAIYEFYSSQLELVGLQEWPELNGRTYKTLPEQVRRGVDRRYLSSIILLQETAKAEGEAERLKQLVFERINSGGVRLEHQESRNAIYDGRLNRLCIQLSRTPSLCRLWGIPEPTLEEIASGGKETNQELLDNDDYRQMRDVELVLRFFANRQRELHNTSTLYLYLDNFLQYGNRWDQAILESIAIIFRETIDLVESLFGETAFWVQRQRRSGEWEWRQSPTTVVYDPLMRVASSYLSKKQALIQVKETLNAGRERLFRIDQELFGGRAVNPSKQTDRESALTNLFDSAIG